MTKPRTKTRTWKQRALEAEARVRELEGRLDRMREAYGLSQSELGLHDYSTGHPDDRPHEMGQ